MSNSGFFDFDALSRSIEGDVFDERPVDIETFIYGAEYLNQTGIELSANQLKLIQVSTQILKRETLHYLYGEEAGEARWKDTYTKIVFLLGKGSGKNMCSVYSCLYVVYQLMCLKDPAAYYGKPPGDPIDLVNIAINADQARRNFFDRLKGIVERSPWFVGKFDPTAISLKFDKNVNVYSGHSEREAFEGLNLIFAVLDEISGFAVDSESGNENAKTGEAIYKMYDASVLSRFSKFGKLVMMSFPRFKGDFLHTYYEKVISKVDLVQIPRNHTFKINPELPDGYEGNEFSINWTEDHVTHYTLPGVFALRRPVWDFNPQKTIDEYASAFFEDPLDAIGRFAAEPPDAVGGFFRNHDKVDRLAMGSNLVNTDTGDWRASVTPDATKQYFIHIDLALKHDNAALAMSHVDHWQHREFGNDMNELLPVIKVDLLRVWKPGQSRSVDFSDIKEFILEIINKGFTIKLITLDRWRSDEMLEWIADLGITGEILSVALPHYQDLLGILNEERAVAPESDLLRKEIKQLRLVNNGKKIDHPRNGSKDLADAVCGSIYNAMSRSERDYGDEIEVVSLEDLRRRGLRASMDAEPTRYVDHAPGGTEIPEEIQNLLGLKVL